MGMCSKSCCGLSLQNVSLTTGQEYTEHGARLCPRNVQHNTRAGTAARGKRRVSATGRKGRAINTGAEAKRSVKDTGKHRVTGQEGTGCRRGSLQDSKRQNRQREGK